MIVWFDLIVFWNFLALPALWFVRFGKLSFVVAPYQTWFRHLVLCPICLWEFDGLPIPKKLHRQNYIDLSHSVWVTSRYLSKSYWQHDCKSSQHGLSYRCPFRCASHGCFTSAILHILGSSCACDGLSRTSHDSHESYWSDLLIL